VIRFSLLQFRAQALAAIGCLAVLTAALVVTGPHLAQLYDTSVASCQAHGDCPAVTTAFLLNDRSLQTGLNVLAVALPALLGIFWGAPLAARELETGIFRFAWTQTITRTRWMAVRLAVAGLASLAVAGLVTLMVTWWSSPLDTVSASPFAAFDERDLIPVGWTAFTFAAGVAAGVLIRRTLPAMAATLAAFAAVRAVINKLVRPHLITPLQISVPDSQLTANGHASVAAGALSPRDWVLSDQTINGAGHVIGQNGLIGNAGLNISVGPGGVSIQGIGSCPGLRPLSNAGHPGGGNNAIQNMLIQKCADQLRVHELFTYQPASRYWALQWYETAILLGLALSLAAFSIWRTRRLG
jgi:hypothetical protein